MEEILASIRRIIADDDGAKSQPRPAEAVASPRPAVLPPRAPAPVPPPVAPAPRAAPPPPPTPAPEPAQSQEEIDAMLAQLQAVHAAAPAQAKATAEEPAADILDLTEPMAAAAPPPQPAPAPAASSRLARGFRTIDAQSDVVFEESAALEPPAAPARIADDLRHRARNGDESTLISSATSAAVDSAFNSLAQTVLVQNARTLEDLVREMLRPMLKSWLDDNLPNLVERLVRAEIERVSRGRS
jgi:cell pole-organizing protein PopZ